MLVKLHMAYTDAKKPEEELVKEITEQFDLSKRFLDPIHERMNQQEELFRSYIDVASYPHQARVFDPRVFRAIETVTPRLVQNEPTGSFYPAENNDVIGAQVLNIMLKQNWQKAGMFEKLVRYLKSMLIFGTAFGRTFWNYDERTVKRLKPVDMNGRMVWSSKNTEEVNVVVVDRPDFEVLNIYDCYPDPNATSLDNMRWFILRRFRSFEELKRENENRFGVYKNLDKLERMYKNSQSDASGASAGGAGDAGNLYFREHRRTMLQTEEFIGQDKSNKDIVTLLRYDRDGNVCEIAPEYENLIIRESENPYFHGQMPIVYGVDYPYPNELYGIGEVEPVDRLQRAINAVVNQRLDNVQLILRNMWKVRKGAGVDMHTLVSAPGNIITTDDMNAIEPVAIPDATGGTFVQTMEYLTSALQNGTGITDYTIGSGNDNVMNKTATGVRLIQQEANAQFKLKIQLINHMVIAKIADQWKDLMIQFTTDQQMMRIVGKDEVLQLAKNTDLGKLNLSGEEVVPGSEEVRKLDIRDNGNFAFLHVYPDDIQPAVAGDYDFVPTISSEMVNDPIAMQNNFFIALEKVMSPEFIQGLMSEGKQPKYSTIYNKVFEKLNLGFEGDELLTDMAPAQQAQQTVPEITPDETQSFLADRGNMFPDYAEESATNAGQ